MLFKSVAFLFLILSLSVFASEGGDEGAVFAPSKKLQDEVVLFFSPSCEGCYSTSALMSAWKMMRSKVDVKFVPVTGSRSLDTSARIYFLIGLLQSQHRLSNSSLVKTSFSVYKDKLSKVDSGDMVAFFNAFRSLGLDVTPIDFKLAWDLSGEMLIDSQEIVKRTNYKGEKIPFSRVYNDSLGSVVYIHEDTPEKFFSRLNQELNL